MSLCSGRSLRSSERSYRDEMDSMSLSSGHKRMILGQRMSKLNSRNMSSMESTIGSSNCIAENVCLEITETNDEHPEAGLEAVELKENPELQAVVVGSVEGQSQEPAMDGNQSQKASIESSTVLDTADEFGQAIETDSPSRNGGAGGPNMSKTAILRNIFFSQIGSTSPSASCSNAGPKE